MKISFKDHVATEDDAFGIHDDDDLFTMMNKRKLTSHDPLVWRRHVQ